MARVVVRKAVASDSNAIKALFKETPQKAPVSINFEREPDYWLSAGVVAEKPQVLVACDSESKAIVGCSSYGSRRVFINGEPQWIKYAGDLRVHPQYRKGRALLYLYRAAKKDYEPGEWCQTAILANNDTSIQTIAANRSSVPHYRLQGKLISHLIHLDRRPFFVKNKTVWVRQATVDDIPAMQCFFNKQARNKQFYPCYDFSRVESEDPYYFGMSLNDFYLGFDANNRLVGMMGVCDQNQFKQTRFTHYRGGLKILRQVYNMITHFTGGIRLPKEGGVLNYCSLYSVVIQNNNPVLFKQLLYQVLPKLRQQKVQGLVAAFMDNDPLNQALGGLRRHKVITNHYLACYDDIDPLSQLDDRIPYLESIRL